MADLHHPKRVLSPAGSGMGWGMFLICWAVAAAIALVLGRDTNWDLRNYHYYNSYALLEGRWNFDLAPAGAHSFLHPGLDLPFYLLTQSPLNTWPRLASTLQAGYAGLLGFLTIAVTNLACNGKAGRVTAASVLASSFGLTGAATLPETGSTFNDIQVACLVVGALLALLLAASADDATKARQATWLRLLAGLLGGCAVGLKLTAAVFPPALALVVLVTARSGTIPKARALAFLVLGGTLGFLMTYGPWGWFLWKRFGNPFGPFANSIFRSPLFPLTEQRDERFLPGSVAEALAYPFLWARTSTGIVMEPSFADPRFAVGLTALLVVIALVAWRWLQHCPCAGPPSHGDWGGREVRAVLVFLVASYLIWLGAFSILRYAIPVEVLLGIPVYAAARGSMLAARPETEALIGTGRWRSSATLVLATVFGACALLTDYPAHPREPFFWASPPRGAAVVAVTPIALPEGALVVMLSPAVSFVVPFLQAPGVRFAGEPNAEWAGVAREPATYAAHVVREIHSHRGPAFVLLEDPASYDRGSAETLGIAFDPASCRPVPNNLTRAVQLCRWR